MSPLPLAPEDLALMKRFARGRIRPDTWRRELFIRLLWAHVRLMGSRDALTHLLRAGWSGGSPAMPPADELRVWLFRVREADGADVTPSRTSAEFLWRHAELLTDAPDAGRAAPERRLDR